MRKFAIIAAISMATVLAVGAFVGFRVQHLLQSTRNQVASEAELGFDFGPLPHIDNPGFEPLAAPNSYRTGAVFEGKLYLAGSAGLAEYNSLQAVPKLLQTGLDLPPAPIVRMTTGMLRGDSNRQLILATNGEGILWFDGQTFRQLRPRNPAARDITALLPLASGDLLIGTRQLGLLIFNGKTLKLFHPNLAGLNVTALAGDEGDFWVGTRNRGVLHWHAGQLDAFNGEASDTLSNRKASDLPDPQVESIALVARKAYIGTPVGVKEFDDGRPVRTLVPGFFAHALHADGATLTAASIDEGVREVSLSPQPPSISRRAEAFEVEEFFNEDGLVAVGRTGVFRRLASGGWMSVLKATEPPLTDRNVAALSFAPDGRLWIGYFDRGLDILNVDNRAGGDRFAEHAEDDHVFCINRIVADPVRDSMDVATANGLALFDTSGRERQVLLRRDGLIADQVTDISVTTEDTVVATPAGLTFIDASGMQSIYAFQGLVNNHVYSLSRTSRDNRMLAATLGGISLLDGKNVRRNLTASNSGLKHNWTTAIVAVDDGWFVGTYGAGVMRLDSAGRFTAMDGVGGPMEINPNAMLVTGRHVFAGSLGGGLFVYDRGSDRWSPVTAGLPSLNVTALAAHDGEIYVGTDNGVVRVAEARLP
jgi:hypothetical protein